MDISVHTAELLSISMLSPLSLWYPKF